MPRLLPSLLIAFAVLISAGAVANVLPIFGLGVETWYGPLAVLDRVYADLLDRVLGGLIGMVDERFGILIPDWAPHLAVLYLAAALAFVAGTTGVARRDRIIENVKATALGAVVPLAIPLFIWNVFRMGLVSRFARDNSLSFFAYVALVAGAYFASVAANNMIYAPEASTQTASVSREEIDAMGAMERGSSTPDATGPGNALIVRTAETGEPAIRDGAHARELGEALGRTLSRQQATVGAPGQENEEIADLDPSASTGEPEIAIDLGDVAD